MGLPNTIKELRRVYGDTQQAFSNRLEMALATIGHYELGSRTPDAVASARLAQLAEAIHRPDLAKPFQDIVRDAMGGMIMPIRSEDEHRKLRAVQYVLFDERFAADRAGLNKALKKADAHLRRLERKKMADGQKLMDEMDALAKAQAKGKGKKK